MANEPLDFEQQAEDGVPDIPQVTVDRGTVEELELRRMQKTQTTCLFILAIATGLALAYVAKMVLVVLFTSVLLAFVLAPLVDFGVRFGLPRALSALIAIFLLIGICYGITFVSYNKAVDFLQDMPRYSHRIREFGTSFQRKAEALRRTTEDIVPQSQEEKQAVTIKQSTSISDLVTGALGSVGEAVFTISFIPFLAFFMLSWQEHVRSKTVMLFKMENRNTAYVTLGAMSGMIRSFLVGNLLVGLFVSVVSLIIFGVLGLPFFYFIGFISGFLSIIPYLGVVLAVIPPIITGMGVLTIEKAIIIVLAVLGLHLFSMNVLYPKILGKRLQLNPLTVTIALLFWGWLWGAMGLILAIPVTAAIKIVLEHVEGFEGYGQWMGE
ncbi:MAG TPA: AI-2E family transporter [Candidatus Koribacter sp.]|jgi:predicted PurR-regulated permease PerM